MTVLTWVVLVVAILLVALLILPRFRAKLGAQGVPSRTEALLGKTGIVTETIDRNLGTGRVRIAGEDWAAQSESTLTIGSLVRVEGADGIVLRVSSSASAENELKTT